MSRWGVLRGLDSIRIIWLIDVCEMAILEDMIMSRLTNRTVCPVMSMFLSAILCTAAAGKIIYVDDDVVAITHTGSSWALAYDHLQDALTNVNSSEEPVEIRVAQGIYAPDLGIGITPGDRDASFQLTNSVVLKGGYAGFGEPNSDARDIELYETILSGDLAGDDLEVSDPCDLLEEPTRAENSYTVVTVTDNNCFIDGFTISSGNADEPIELPDDPFKPVVIERIERSAGGGMYINPSFVTITNCTFKNNAARREGGGIYSVFGRGPSLNNCIFMRNSSGCVIKGESTNFIFGGGGGMYNLKNSPTLINCRFTENSSVNGAGILNNESSPTLTNCIFSGNRSFILGRSRSLGTGGGVSFRDECRVNLTNCTFAQNSAGSGNTLTCNSFNRMYPSVLKLINCILWDGCDEIENHDNSIIEITCSDLQGGWSGEGKYNIDTDPLFANPGCWVDANDPNVIVEPDDPNAVWIDGDYHLKSQAGRYDTENKSWVIDDVTSLCIDAGDPNIPVGDEPEPNGGRINMGAYGGSSEASMTP
jgi:hypothetical protein